ncbi:MAG TPA: phosphotransferase [Solirubrobacteraceae bacterium]|nr:phosphotransferase [Solirubrobacteraceae bacterium]
MGELHDIVARLEPTLGPILGEPVALEGGITNRNFRVRLGGIDYVIRRPGKDTALLGIDREAERMAAEAAARLGLAPAVAAVLDGGLVTLLIPCTQVGGEELSERAGEIGAALREFHDCGVVLPRSFWVPDLLGDYTRIVLDRGGRLSPEYRETISLAERIAGAIPLVPPSPCHNDLLAGNIIRADRGGRLMIVDWEYAGMGHPYFDLGNLSVNNDFDEATDERLLAAYHGRPPSDSERATLKLMRVLSDAREAAWGVLQAEISELDFDFTGYGGAHFQRLLAVGEAADFEEWLAAA